MMDNNLPDVPQHPVLRLMEASTAASLEHSYRVVALEKSVDRAALALERLAAAEERAFKEMARINDIEERSLVLKERMDGERWTRYSKLFTDAGTSASKAFKHPAVTLPLGAVGYGVAKVVAQLFGFDMGALP